MTTKQGEDSVNGGGSLRRGQHCSFAVTGAQQSFIQDVYVCLTCCAARLRRRHHRRPPQTKSGGEMQDNDDDKAEAEAEEDDDPPQTKSGAEIQDDDDEQNKVEEQERQDVKVDEEQGRHDDEEQEEEEIEELLGVCQACAMTCHSDHEIRHLGTGRAYCDCHRLLSPILTTTKTTTTTDNNDESDNKNVDDAKDDDETATDGHAAVRGLASGCDAGGCQLLDLSVKFAKSLWPPPPEEGRATTTHATSMTTEPLVGHLVVPQPTPPSQWLGAEYYCREIVVMDVNDDDDDDGITTTTNSPVPPPLPSDTFLRQAYLIPELIHHNRNDDMSNEKDWDPSPSPFCQLLQQQAMELIQHSKETFWIGASTIQDFGTVATNESAQDKNSLRLCALERLACQIAQHHRHQYFSHHEVAVTTNDGSSSSYEKKNNENDDDWTQRGGLEWWVQVKYIRNKTPTMTNNDEPTTEEPENTNQQPTATPLHLSTNRGDAPSPYDDNDEAVDLHYDKDEVLAEAFGLGLFPTLSTVTYLTGGTPTPQQQGRYSPLLLLLPPQPPTVVFPRCYHADDDEVPADSALLLRNMWISHPQPGKHIVFDGRLLHGAPANLELRLPQPMHQEQRQQKEAPTTSQTTIRDGRNNRDQGKLDQLQQQQQQKYPEVSVRITFLVNVWHSHRPAGITSLPESIRQSLLALEPPPQEPQAHNSAQEQRAFLPSTNTWVPQSYPTVRLKTKSQLPEQLRQRISLPFVGGSGSAGNPKEDATFVLDHNNKTESNELEEDGEQEEQHMDKINKRENRDEDNDNDNSVEAGMVVMTYPPPSRMLSNNSNTSSHTNFSSSVWMVEFGHLMEAYLAYDEDEEDDDEGVEQEPLSDDDDVV
ncbi:hypothetical protein ACA910_013410 [Epithemia clementina (nom. ined.)]